MHGVLLFYIMSKLSQLTFKNQEQEAGTVGKTLWFVRDEPEGVQAPTRARRAAITARRHSGLTEIRKTHDIACRLPQYWGFPWIVPSTSSQKPTLNKNCIWVCLKMRVTSIPIISFPFFPYVLHHLVWNAAPKHGVAARPYVLQQGYWYCHVFYFEIPLTVFFLGPVGPSMEPRSGRTARGRSSWTCLSSAGAPAWGIPSRRS